MADILAFDVGGSSVKYGLIRSTDEKKLDFVLKRCQPLQEEKFGCVRRIVFNVIEQIIKQYPDVDAVVVSTKGHVNEQDGLVVRAGGLLGYKNIYWEKLIRSKFQRVKKVFVVNDGKASAWAEFLQVKKAYPGSKYFAHFVVGSGVGGALIFDGKFVEGDSSQGCFIGHLNLTELHNTLRCSCGSYGCLESLASAKAIVRYYNENRHGGRSEKSFPEIVECALAGEDRAVRAGVKAGTYLGKGVALIVNLFSPCIVTIGGGVPQAFSSHQGTNIYLNAVRSATSQYAHWRVQKFTKVKMATFRNDGGMLGAAHLFLRSSGYI